MSAFFNFLPIYLLNSWMNMVSSGTITFIYRISWRNTLKEINCKDLNLWVFSFKHHLDVSALKILTDPLIPFLQLFSTEVVLPVTNLSFSEEFLHVVIHLIAFAKHWLSAVFAKVVNVEVVIKSQDLWIVSHIFSQSLSAKHFFLVTSTGQQ